MSTDYATADSLGTIAAPQKSPTSSATNRTRSNRRGRRRQWLSEEEYRAKQQREAQEALTRARSQTSLANDAHVIRQFAARGIPAAEIRPRENVFTFKAWRALGRHVRRGEKSVKVTTYAPAGEPDENGRQFSRPVTACVFHISQTDPND